jgi:hypothetical protein
MTKQDIIARPPAFLAPSLDALFDESVVPLNSSAFLTGQCLTVDDGAAHR